MKGENNLSKEQKKQELNYSFPYHYLPVWTGWYFSQVKCLSWGYQYMAYLNLLLDMLVEDDFEYLLDVGCGDGRFLFELSKKIPAEKLAGIDYSKRAIGFAKVMLPDDVRLEWGDITEQKTVEGKFDVITLIETLEHIKPECISNFLEAINNKLAGKGKFILTVPSDNVDLNLKHFQHFSEEKLRKILNPFFDVIKVVFLRKKQGFFLSALEKIMKNNLFILNNNFLNRHIYKYYCKNYLYAQEHNCTQIMVVCEKKII